MPHRRRQFSLEQVEPTEPGPGEVRIEVAFCGICSTDLHVYLGHMDPRIGHHRVIGHEMSGTVDAAGPDVDGVASDDRIVVRPLDACGKCPCCRRGYRHVCRKLTFLGLVIGGGPIGMLVALVARQRGANVTISEIDTHRLAMAEHFGMTTVNPKDVDAVQTIMEATGGKGSDVVFEVSGTQPGVDLMTAVTATRGRIVMVAIHATKPRVDLFQCFRKEIEMLGARVYEPEDYDEAIRLIAGGDFDARGLITGVRPLEEIQAAFEELAGNPEATKTPIRCGDEAALSNDTAETA